jgi:hypothetical protein
VPPRASSRGMVDGSYAINGVRESDRSRERLWGERQRQGVTEIVERHQQAVRASGAVCRVLPSYRARACRVPRSPPQRQIAPRADWQEPADIWPRVSSLNTLFRSGTVSSVPPCCLGGAGSRLSASCPREDGRGIQPCGKPIAEAELIAFFRGLDSLRDRTLFLLMLRCSLRVSQVSRLPWSGNLRHFSLDASPRVVSALRVGRQHQHRDGPSGHHGHRARSSINALA